MTTNRLYTARPQILYGGKTISTRKPPLKSHEGLIVYQKSILLASDVLTLTRVFPRSERYELVSQIRRAAESIPSNIVEGYRRKSRKEYIQFLHVAYGSCGELGTHLRISLTQRFISDEAFSQVETLRDEVSRMLWSMIDILSSKPQ